MRPMVVATIASIKPREKSLAVAVKSILPQVDRLYAYLNGYDSVPACLLTEGVAHALTSAEAGWRGTECRFFFVDPKGYAGAMRPPQDAIHLPIDDDIEYPPDYVEQMIAAMGRNPGALVCVHASVLSTPFESYATSRRQLSFVAGLSEDAPAHIPGMGTAAYRLSEVPIALADFDGNRACDPVVAAICRRKEIPVISVARPPGWLRSLPTPAGSRLYRQRSAANNTGAEDAIIRSVSWPDLSVPATTVRGDVAARAARKPRRAPESRFPAQAHGRPRSPADPGPDVAPVHFALIVPGWNCADRVRLCWESLLAQTPGAYTWEAWIADDGSTDRTWAEIENLPDDPRLHRMLLPENLGAAHARWRIIERISGPETVCGLLDLDDRLEPGALARVALEYRAHPRTRLTYGSWAPEGSGRFARDPGASYSRADISARRFRQTGMRAGHFRTFRRHLADAVIPGEHLQLQGEWLRAGTDAALLYPLLEQCDVGEIRRIDETLYRYWQREDNASARVTPLYRQRVRSHLRAIAPVPARAHASQAVVP